jgi:glycine cleavage system H protein
MASVKNCNLPDDLYYNIDNNVWARREPDGSVTIGMTAYACALAGEVVAYTPKKVGRSVELNKSAATVESGKWVGPVKAPVAGEVVAVNEAVSASPKTINADPYGSGWLVKLKPANWDADAAALVTGAAVATAFEAKMAADGFNGCP